MKEDERKRGRREGRGIERSSSPVVIKGQTENYYCCSGRAVPVSSSPLLRTLCFLFFFVLLSLPTEPKLKPAIGSALLLHVRRSGLDEERKKEWRRELKDVQRSPNGQKEERRNREMPRKKFDRSRGVQEKDK